MPFQNTPGEKNKDKKQKKTNKKQNASKLSVVFASNYQRYKQKTDSIWSRWWIVMLSSNSVVYFSLIWPTFLLSRYAKWASEKSPWYNFTEEPIKVMEQKRGRIPKTLRSKPFLFSQPPAPPKLACLVWIKLNEAWKSLCCERCTVNMKRWCPSSADVSCKFQYQNNPSSASEQMGKPQMTAHQRY